MSFVRGPAALASGWNVAPSSTDTAARYRQVGGFTSVVAIGEPSESTGFPAGAVVARRGVEAREMTANGARFVAVIGAGAMGGRIVRRLLECGHEVVVWNRTAARAAALIALGVVGEALALAGSLGLSRDAAFDVLASTPLAAQAGRRRPAVEADRFPPRFALALARKDAELVVDAAAAAGVELRHAAAAMAWYREAEAAGLGDRDYSTILAWIPGSRFVPALTASRCRA